SVLLIRLSAFFYLVTPPPPTPTLFPYTTLFRSQSIVHSMVRFTDGSTIAQASPPDMRLPIALALTWPDRLPGASAPCDWSKAATWTFEPLDNKAFPAVELAREAGLMGGCVPAVYNAANEEAVAAFRAQNAGFTSIVDTVSEVVSATDEWRREPRDIDDVLAAEAWARQRARGRNS